MSGTMDGRVSVCNAPRVPPLESFFVLVKQMALFCVCFVCFEEQKRVSSLDCDKRNTVLEWLVQPSPVEMR